MKSYKTQLKQILDEGVEKESGRENMPNTIGLSHGSIEVDLSKGFPLLTTKHMFWKGVVHELLWFLRGETNIKYLVDNNVNIWNGDAYRWYTKWWDANESELIKLGEDRLSMEELIYVMKEGNIKTYQWDIANDSEDTYTYGDLGKVYGYQWRNQNGVDQIMDVVTSLKMTPYSRYHIIDGWNKADFSEMALPPCHLLYQFIVRPLSLVERGKLYQKANIFASLNDDADHVFFDSVKTPKFYLDMNMYQRSCDFFLGVPFNLASMSLKQMIFAKLNNMIPGVGYWTGGDVHLYTSHVGSANEQLSRKPYKLPKLKIMKELKTFEDVLSLTIDDFKLTGYKHHDKIYGELFTGNKK